MSRQRLSTVNQDDQLWRYGGSCGEMSLKRGYQLDCAPSSGLDATVSQVSVVNNATSPSLNDAAPVPGYRDIKHLEERTGGPNLASSLKATLAFPG